MVIDSSALVAVVLEEQEALTFLERMRSEEHCSISAFTLTEASVALLRRHGQIKVAVLHALISRLGVHVQSVDAEQARIATEAYRRFGKGRHSASLNLGDCFSYALAIRLNEPLLFKGNDFGQTDVLVA
jgi:ribonuclease VapC